VEEGAGGEGQELPVGYVSPFQDRLLANECTNRVGLGGSAAGRLERSFTPRSSTRAVGSFDSGRFPHF
jgi:hypothetical protein